MDINLTPKLRRKMFSRSRVRGRYNSSELFFILSGKTTPEQWMKPTEKSMKEMLTMWAGIGMHNQIQNLLGAEDEDIEQKREFVYKDIVLVGKSDYLPPDKPDEVWEFKTSEKAMKESKPWHDHQVKLYCTMFEKAKGLVYQPVQDNDGIYLRHLSTQERDDKWFLGEMDKLYAFHLKVEELWKRGLTNGK
jgi:hypothetical protein